MHFKIIIFSLFVMFNIFAQDEIECHSMAENKIEIFMDLTFNQNLWFYTNDEIIKKERRGHTWGSVNLIIFDHNTQTPKVNIFNLQFAGTRHQMGYQTWNDFFDLGQIKLYYKGKTLNIIWGISSISNLPSYLIHNKVTYKIGCHPK